jgi:DNA-binding protein YbaB
MGAEQELAGLKQQAEYLKNTLDEIHKRIEQLEAEGKQK